MRVPGNGPQRPRSGSRIPGSGQSVPRNGQSAPRSMSPSRRSSGPAPPIRRAFRGADDISARSGGLAPEAQERHSGISPTTFVEKARVKRKNLHGSMCSCACLRNLPFPGCRFFSTVCGFLAVSARTLQKSRVLFRSVYRGEATSHAKPFRTRSFRISLFYDLPFTPFQGLTPQPSPSLCGPAPQNARM